MDGTPAGRSLQDQRHRTRGRAVLTHPRTHRPREQNCPHRPNHRGIPATTSSAGDPPLERNPASLPPPIQQENHTIDRVFTQPGSLSEVEPSNCKVCLTTANGHQWLSRSGPVWVQTV